MTDTLTRPSFCIICNFISYNSPNSDRVPTRKSITAFTVDFCRHKTTIQYSSIAIQGYSADGLLYRCPHRHCRPITETVLLIVIVSDAACTATVYRQTRDRLNRLIQYWRNTKRRIMECYCTWTSSAKKVCLVLGTSCYVEDSNNIRMRVISLLN